MTSQKPLVYLWMVWPADDKGPQVDRAVVVNEPEIDAMTSRNNPRKLSVREMLVEEWNKRHPDDPRTEDDFEYQPPAGGWSHPVYPENDLVVFDASDEWDQGLLRLMKEEREKDNGP